MTGQELSGKSSATDRPTRAEIIEGVDAIHARVMALVGLAARLVPRLDQTQYNDLVSIANACLRAVESLTSSWYPGDAE